MKKFMLGKLLGLILWNLIGIACPEIVAFWPMNEGEGKTVRDESGNKADLKLVGLTKWADGIRGSGLEFNGQPKNYAISKNAKINFPGSFTIEGWFKPHQINGFIINTAADIENGESTNVIIWVGLGLTKDWKPAPVLTGRLWTQGGWESFLSSKAIHPNQWYHFAYVFDIDAPAHLLYLNGKKVKSQATKGNRLFHQNGKHNAYVLGANAENNDFGIPYNGLVDEIRVHDKVLKGNAVKESMQELSIEPTDQLLVLRWAQIKRTPF